MKLQGVIAQRNFPNIYHCTSQGIKPVVKLPWHWAGEPNYLHPSLSPVSCISQEQPQGPQKLLSALVPPKQGRWHVNLGSCAPTIHPAPCGTLRCRTSRKKHSPSTFQSHRTTADPARRREDGHSPPAGSQGSPREVPLSLCSINHLLLNIRSCSTSSACSKHSSTGTSRNLSLGSSLDCTQS